MGLAAAAIEGLRRQRVEDGYECHIRLLAKGETQAKGAMRGQVAEERIRRRLAIIPGVFFRFRLARRKLVAFASLCGVLRAFFGCFLS